MILTVGTSLALSRTMIFDRVAHDGVNRAKEVRVSAAGKSVNAARAAHTLGENVTALGIVGGCTGRELRDELDRSAIAHDFVDATAATRVCVTAIDRSAGSATELIEEPAAISSDESDRLWELLLRHMPSAKFVIASGTLAPNIPPGFYAMVCRLARDVGATGIVDAKGPELLATLSCGPLLVKPNRSELASAMDRPAILESDEELHRAMSELIKSGAKNVAVTSGPGAVWFANAEQFVHLTPPTVKPVSPIGSGDAFAGGFAAGLSRGLPAIEAAKLGVACGTANALTEQAGFLDPREVDRLLKLVQIA